MRLNPYLRSDLVLAELTAGDTEEVLEAVARHLEARGAVASAATVGAALRAREAAHTTVMGHGMALPHATIAGLAQPVLMVALSGQPIQFGPFDTEPVRVFFVLLSPPGREGEHIKLLARICRLLRHPGFMDQLLAAGTADEVLGLIRRVDEQHV
jgi:mannitol/fructose-specific phosphotransferase system IIA component (Ntr-type)